MGNYRIIRRLAAGGMAEVFLGKLVGAGGFEKPVAIKRMLPNLAEDAASAEAFLQEARLCVHLVHPNVVQVLDLGTSGGAPYLVMELVDGEDLRKILAAAARAGEPLGPAEAIHVAACVAEALAHAYDAPGPGGEPLRVVHRDVNPSNVLISVGGEVKLADFGVAKAADGRQVTEGNLLKGKLGYLAPELLGGSAAGHESDVFLTGVLLWEMLAGRQLFGGGGPPGKTLAQIAAHDESTLELPEAAPEELHPVLRKALARDPANRYGHARELAAALRELLDDKRWRVGRDTLAARLASLFPDRPKLDQDLAGGVPLVDDREASAASTAAAARLGQPVAPRRTAAEEPAVLPRGQRRRLGEMLVEAGLVTEAQLATLLQRQRQEGGRLGEWVVTLGFAPERAVMQVLAKQLGVPFVTDEKLLEARPPPELLARLPQELAMRLQALPLSERDGHVFVALADPGNLEKLDLLRFRLGKVKPIVCSEGGLRRALANAYGDPAANSRMIDFDSGPVQMGVPVSAGAPVAAIPMQPVTPGPAALPAQGTPPGASAGTPPVVAPPGFMLAYVPTGFGADGQPIYVAVPVPQPVTGGPAVAGLPLPATVTPGSVQPATPPPARTNGAEREIELELDGAEELELAEPLSARRRW